MSRFTQLHLLTSYPPSNLNRDDLGRPKSAVMGGANRMRVSSQSLKRAWRTSEPFEATLKGHVGTRTKRMGIEAYESLIEKGVKEKQALRWAWQIANVFGKVVSAEKKEKEVKDLALEQLAHFSVKEQAGIDDLVEKLAETGEGPTDDDLELLREEHKSADIAMFGRMLASSPKYNTEAAVQVAHAITVHKVAAEDDYFTAVDDLNLNEDDMGAAHIGETEFAAGLYYLYICVDCNLLRENLSDDVDLAKRTIAALAECAATVSPTGKQNSFASRAHASYILAEKGDYQPRSLSVAYLKPTNGTDLMDSSIKQLMDTKEKMDKAYGLTESETCVMNTHDGTGCLQDIVDFVKGGIDDA